MLKVWIADTTPLEDPEIFKRWLMRVPYDRKEKVLRIAAPEGRIRSLGAGALFDTALIPLGLDGAEIEVSKYGKPYFKDRDDLYFNLSHSGSRAMLVLSDNEVGCDVEQIRDTVASQKVAAHFFCEEEKAFIARAADETEKRERFFRLWTLKESYIKATAGKGSSTGKRSRKSVIGSASKLTLLSANMTTRAATFTAASRKIWRR